jgi:hypothetical protein
MNGVVDRYIQISRDDSRWQQISPAADCYPASLAYGKISVNHPFAAFLEQHGAKTQELAWFETNPRKPDLLGYNFYPDFAYGWDERPDHRNNDYTKGGTVPVQKGAGAAAALLIPGITRAQRYFDLPVYLTETSAGQSVEARIAYIHALGDWATDLRRQGIPLRGINWWPLFDTLQWTYREDVSLPLRDFIFVGGWNNGLYRIQAAPDGDLKRVPTAAVQAFHDMIASHS